MGLTQFGVCKPLTASNPMFGASAISLNRDTKSVVVLTPNIGLIFSLRPAHNFKGQHTFEYAYRKPTNRKPMQTSNIQDPLIDSSLYYQNACD